MNLAVPGAGAVPTTMDLSVISVLMVAILVGVEGLLPFEVIDDVVTDYRLPALPYDYDGLEPYLDGPTLRVHHTGHHAGYTKKLNGVLKQWREEQKSDKLASESILKILENLNQVPEQYRTTVRNVGGGFVNHNLYFSVMSPNPLNESRVPVEGVANLIDKHFGNFKTFKDMFTAEANKLFGSGYVWLCQQQISTGESDQSLRYFLTTSTNQDAPMTNGLQPILILDVWEHAYYLKHQNKRGVYIDDWWSVVNWRAVADLSEWWLKRDSTHDEL